MKLQRANTWYRPYTVHGYTVKNIHFYNDNGIVVSTRCGYLTDIHGADIKEIDINTETIAKRRKVNFTRNEVFIITAHNDCTNELYIPVSLLNIQFAKYEYRNKMIFAIYYGDDNIKISDPICSLYIHLYQLRNEYEKIYKECSDTDICIEKNEICFNKLDNLKALAYDIKDEIKLLSTLNVEEAIKLAKKRGIWEE